MSFRTPQTIVPRLPGDYVNGKWQDGDYGEPFTVMASVQPSRSGDYDQMRAEQPGRRISRMVRIYTDVRLTVAGEDDTNGDSLDWFGDRYLIIAVSPHQSGVIPHYRYLAVRTALP